MQSKKKKGAPSTRANTAAKDARILAKSEAKAHAKALRLAKKAGLSAAGREDAAPQAAAPTLALATAGPQGPVSGSPGGVARSHPPNVDVVTGSQPPVEDEPDGWIYAFMLPNFQKENIVHVHDVPALESVLRQLMALQAHISEVVTGPGPSVFSQHRLEPIRGLLLQSMKSLVGEWFAPDHSAYITGHVLAVVNGWGRGPAPLFTVQGFSPDALKNSAALGEALEALAAACKMDAKNFTSRKHALLENEVIQASARSNATKGAEPTFLNDGFEWAAPEDALRAAENKILRALPKPASQHPADTGGPAVNDLLSLLASRTAAGEVAPCSAPGLAGAKASASAGAGAAAGVSGRTLPGGDIHVRSNTGNNGREGYGLLQPDRRDARAVGGEGQDARGLPLPGAYSTKESVMAYVYRICPPLEQCLPIEVQLERARQRQLSGLPPPKRGEEALFSPTMDLHTFQKACTGYATEYLTASPQAASDYARLIDILCALQDRVPITEIMDFEYVVRQNVALNKMKFSDAHPSSQVWLKYLSPSLTRAALTQDGSNLSVDSRLLCRKFLEGKCFAGKTEGGGCGGLHACALDGTISNGAQGCTLCHYKMQLGEKALRTERSVATASAAEAARQAAVARSAQRGPQVQIPQPPNPWHEVHAPYHGPQHGGRGGRGGGGGGRHNAGQRNAGRNNNKRGRNSPTS